jgi:hypothetical protein
MKYVNFAVRWGSALTLSVLLIGLSTGCLHMDAGPQTVKAAPAPGAVSGQDLQICGISPSFACGQYVLQIVTQRGMGPRFELYRVEGNTIDTSTMTQVTLGNPITYQAAEPAPLQANTFTLTATEP